MNTKTTITVLGAGYVGLTTAALLAHADYKVYLIEPNKERLDVIKSGRSFFYEEGLDPVIKLAIDSGDLTPTDSYETAIPESSIVFSCVGTPDNPDGSSNLTYVYSAAEETTKHAKDNLIYVQKSTVPVGTGLKIEQLFREKNAKFDYVSNPEFLREGTALYDTLFFDRVVAGGNNSSAVNAIIDVYMNLEQYRDHIAHIAHVPNGTRGDQYIATTLNSAELIKVTSNAFLALKISFANSIALLADKSNADVVEVMNAVGADSRIGRAFLNAGRGYGGGCFPKDVSGLISSGQEYGVDLGIMRAAQSVNAGMPGYVVEQVQKLLGGSLKGKTIAILGLAFKAGTSDVRKSPGIAIANLVKKAGATVRTYDPQANEEAAPDLHNDINQCKTIDDTLQHADAVILATEWQELIDIPATRFSQTMHGTLFFDAVNKYDSTSARDAGLHYVGVGHQGKML